MWYKMFQIVHLIVKDCPRKWFETFLDAQKIKSSVGGYGFGPKGDFHGYFTVTDAEKIKAWVIKAQDNLHFGWADNIRYFEHEEKTFYIRIAKDVWSNQSFKRFLKKNEISKRCSFYRCGNDDYYAILSLEDANKIEDWLSSRAEKRT